MDKTPAASKTPKTLVEAVRYYSDHDRCLAVMVEVRWPNGVECPTCGRKDVRFISTRRVWECKALHARRQFTVKVGTIFEDSPLSLDKWLVAVWMIANCKNGVSSYEVARALDITQKSAWFMLHRIRAAMKSGTFTKMSGRVEADETFVGGNMKFMHKRKREAARKRGHYGRTIVAGLLDRKRGVVKAHVVRNTSEVDLLPYIAESVTLGSEVITDALPTYRMLNPKMYEHQIIDHTESYVRDHVHTNGLENFWSLLKRSIKGTYVSVEPEHLDAYVDEQAFRFNNRKTVDGTRFMRVLKTTVGRRLTHNRLVLGLA
jgi:transposase-like protein